MTDSPKAQPLPGLIQRRLRLVLALTEVNSRHLSGEMRLAAADIELERALEDGRQGLASPALAGRRTLLQQQLDDARRALLSVEAERSWLEQELTNFDTNTPQASPGEP